MTKNKIRLNNEEETKKFAGEFSKNLKKGDVVELIGDLGSGKTFFVRALAEALGAEKVSSPSFVIKNEYTGKRFNILHFDLYRLNGLGIIKEELAENLSSNSLIIIEWGDSAKEILPADRYKIFINVTGENSRELTIYDYPKH
ncbi:MAG: tRNA (adenosine(37)-N6)-threonylcarbamoyltransferase complex ATPase subunit type 1 TsaE [Candidatus Saccharimonadales bacterium]